MRSTIVCLLLLLGAWSALAGETPNRPLTGNARVDFFALQPLPDAGSPSPFISPEMGTPLEKSGRKSPWLAGALSLAVPGAGEMYAGSYIKGGVFFAAEAASILFAVSYDKKGDDQTVFFQNFANEHYSAARYVEWTAENINALNPGVTLADYEIYYDENVTECGPPFDCINWPELNRLESAVASGQINGYTHKMPYYGEQQYYELIGKYDQFSRGWDDADMSDGGVPVRNNSPRFREYAKMRAKANDYYDVASTFASVIVANHILSALDAVWTAVRHNDAIDAGISMKLQPSPIGLVTATTAKVSYKF